MMLAPSFIKAEPEGRMRSPMRFQVLALISAGTMINYLDHTLLGVAPPNISTALHSSPLSAPLRPYFSPAEGGSSRFDG
jgi:hypothetical protein